MPAAAASAPASIVRSPSRKGPVPRRQTKTANTRAEPTRRPQADNFRLIPALPDPPSAGVRSVVPPGAVRLPPQLDDAAGTPTLPAGTLGASSHVVITLRWFVDDSGAA